MEIDNHSNQMDCFDMFSDKLVVDIEKIRLKISNVSSSLFMALHKTLLEELDRDLESLVYGVQYEVGELRREICNYNNPQNQSFECSDELFKARSVIRLQSLTLKISEHINKIVEN